MNAPKPCPEWCTDHRRITADIEQHRGSILVNSSWHEALGRVDDSDRIWMTQDIGPGVTPGSPWAKPNISYNFQCRDPRDTQRIAPMILDASHRLLAAEAGRPYLSVIAALRLLIEDAVPCSDSDCTDGSGPVCDASNLGCQLRRLLLDPSQVHDLISAEHEWSGIDR